jgi:chromosome segregation ATPase
MNLKNVCKETIIALKGPIMVNLFVSITFFASIIQFYGTNNYIFLIFTLIGIGMLYFTTMTLFNIQNERDDLKTQNKDYLLEFEKIRSDLTKKINECFDLQAKLNKYIIRSESLEKEKELLNSEIKTKENKLSDAEDVIKCYYDQIKILEHKNLKDLNMCDKNNLLYNDLYDKHNNLNSDFEKLFIDRDCLKKERDHLKQQRDDLLIENEKVKNELNKFQIDCNQNFYDLQKELNNYHDKDSILTEKLKIMEDQKETHLSEIKSLNYLYNNLQTEHSRLLDHVELLKNNYNVVMSLSENSQKQINELTEMCENGIIQRDSINDALMVSEELMKIKDDLLKRISTVTKPNIKTRPILEEIKKYID